MSASEPSSPDRAVGVDLTGVDELLPSTYSEAAQARAVEAEREINGFPSRKDKR